MASNVGYLRVDGGPPVAVEVWPDPVRTLFRCEDAVAFLRGMGKLDEDPGWIHNPVLRGLIIPGDGAWLQIQDSFGAVTGDIPLSGEETRRLEAALQW